MKVIKKVGEVIHNGYMFIKDEFGNGFDQYMFKIEKNKKNCVYGITKDKVFGIYELFFDDNRFRIELIYLMDGINIG